jgi:hypothetical protein
MRRITSMLRPSGRIAARWYVLISLALLSVAFGQEPSPQPRPFEEYINHTFPGEAVASAAVIVPPDKNVAACLAEAIAHDPEQASLFRRASPVAVSHVAHPGHKNPWLDGLSDAHIGWWRLALTGAAAHDAQQRDVTAPALLAARFSDIVHDPRSPTASGNPAGYSPWPGCFGRDWMPPSFPPPVEPPAARAAAPRKKHTPADDQIPSLRALHATGESRVAVHAVRAPRMPHGMSSFSLGAAHVSTSTLWERVSAGERPAASPTTYKKHLGQRFLSTYVQDKVVLSSMKMPYGLYRVCIATNHGERMSEYALVAAMPGCVTGLLLRPDQLETSGQSRSRMTSTVTAAGMTISGTGDGFGELVGQPRLPPAAQHSGKQARSPSAAPVKRQPAAPDDRLNLLALWNNAPDEILYMEAYDLQAVQERPPAVEHVVDDADEAGDEVSLDDEDDGPPPPPRPRNTIDVATSDSDPDTIIVPVAALDRMQCLGIAVATGPTPLVSDLHRQLVHQGVDTSRRLLLWVYKMKRTARASRSTMASSEPGARCIHVDWSNR